MRRAGFVERLLDHVIRSAGGRNVVAQRQLEANEILEHRRQPRAPRLEIELAQIDAIDLDGAFLRVVQPAQQLRQRGFARAILADDGERRAGRNGEVEAIQHRVAAAAG